MEPEWDRWSLEFAYIEYRQFELLFSKQTSDLQPSLPSLQNQISEFYY